MKNFIFKSSDFGLIKNVSNQLNLVLVELRHQRSEHSVILRQLNLILNQKELDDQVSTYYKKYGEDETSPQTDSDEQ